MGLSNVSLLRQAAALVLVLVCTEVRADSGTPRPLAAAARESGAPLQLAPWAAAMRQEVKKAKKSFPGVLYFYVSDPSRGHRFGYREDEPAYLASGVKIAFMVEAFRQREAGTLSFDKKVTYSASDIRDGATRINPRRLGSRFKVRDLLTWMMQASDNAATDLVAKTVGLRQTTASLVADGIRGFTPLTYMVDVRRGIYRELDIRADDLRAIDIRTIRWTPIWEPQIARLTALVGRPRGTYSRADLFAAYDRFYATRVNRAPMKAIGTILERILAGTMVSEKASREMLALMMGARTSTKRILGRLPAGTRVAHKTGSQFRQLCDLGIIFLKEDHPVVVAACLEGGGVHAAEAIVARLARKAYDLCAGAPDGSKP